MQNWFRGLRPLDTYPNLPEPNRTYLWEFLNHLANSQDTLVKLAEIGVFIEREADRNSGSGPTFLQGIRNVGEIEFHYYHFEVDSIYTSAEQTVDPKNGSMKISLLTLTFR
uniref:Uncharacterized protein n=2 Tax=Anthoceros TaxID=3233 RepID=A0A6M8B1X1_ANTPU|nr:hypothetical protein [Anthoceros punctatus]YP_009863164.1 hypothetical protein [Anthoceros agrestis]QKD76578.1 hypothetical protein [Anthoceros punctatus]QKD76620.1 hypothetical protein [Anthoceros agrestis]